MLAFTIFGLYLILTLISTVPDRRLRRLLQRHWFMTFTNPSRIRLDVLLCLVFAVMYTVFYKPRLL